MTEKKILFIIPSYGEGGTVSSLKAMLSLIGSQVSVDIYPIYRVGPNKEELSNANIVDESIWLSASIKESGILKKVSHLLLSAIRMALALIKIDITPFYLKIGAKRLHLEKYDCIISYSEELTKIVSIIPARKKIAWIHSVYSRYQNLNGGKDEYKYFKNYDKIVCVSDYAKEDFIAIYRSLSDKVRVIYNCCDVQRIKTLSEAYTPLEFSDDNIFKIVSVGRLDPVKQFSSIPMIAYELKKEVGPYFKWLIIGGPCGDGKEADRISSNIIEFQVEDVVQLLGSKSNPYPYIARADTLVHTSSSETFGIVVQEAMSLGIPAILNNYGSAKETVKDGYNGRIVPISQISRVLIQMINDSSYIQQLRVNIMDLDQKTTIVHSESPAKLIELI